MAASSQQDLLSSTILSIKAYTGDDPLRPWLQGIRNLQRSLPPHHLRDKLPRFLQKCAQAFESDPRYRNDSRYLRVWIHLMDYVEDARAVLRRMERNGIGAKRAAFYAAYAMYYEKRKKFEEAERMYHVGVHNLAEPAGELQKSYEQFLQRMMLIKKRKANLQQALPNREKSTSKNIPTHPGKNIITPNYKIDEGLPVSHMVDSGEASQVPRPFTKSDHHQQDAENINPTEGYTKFVKGGSNGSTKYNDMTTKRTVSNVQSSLSNPNEVSDDTVVVKFVGSAIVGKSETEDACHHGLVDPTINMKEAMNAINCMFREPLESEPIAKKSHRSKSKTNKQSSGFEVYVDDSMEEGLNSCYSKYGNNNGAKNSSDIQSYDHHRFTNSDSSKQMVTEFQKPFIGAFEILADGDDDEECADGVSAESKIQSKQNASVHSRPNYQTSRKCYEPNNIISGLREDTVVRRFVGSTVLGAPEVENACHHGLVDPTINMKEAMDDINSMFGKPLDFVKATKPKKQSNFLDKKQANPGFSILADDDLEDSKGKAPSNISCRLDGDDLFDTTVFTKEAMADINEMFGKPLDF